MKTASFHVRATTEQAALWNRAAQAEGHRSAGTWLAAAADSYLKVRARAGLPLPLAWRKGRLSVALSTGEAVEVWGKVAPPFGYYPGTDARLYPGFGKRYFTLLYMPSAKLIATFQYTGQCKALASELARLWVRWGGSEPTEDPAPLLQRFQREDL